ncbi:MAG TPA: hypothetical protein VIK61_01455 [Acidimicrobiia bacterium]
MLWAGGGEQPRRGPGATGSVVAWCLVAAALLSACGVVCEVVAFPGMAISDRVMEAGFLALMPVSLALAAVVALTMAVPRDRRVPGGWSDRAQGLVAVVVAIAILASLYATFAATTGWSFAGRVFSGGMSWTARFGLAGTGLACVLVGASVLAVAARSWRDISAAAPTSLSETGADRTADPTGLLLWSTTGPAIVCVLLATLALSAVSVDRLFSPRGSIGQRLASASSVFSSLPIAFTAFAFVALVAFARRNEARDQRVDFMVAIAALVGALAVAAGAYTTWLIVSGDTLALLHGGIFFGWWDRAGGVADVLTSAAAGAAACYPVWRWRRAEAIRPPVPDGVDEWAEPLSGPEPQPSVSRTAVAQVLPLVGAGLAVAAVGSALSNAMLVVATRGPIPIGTLVAEMGDDILLTTGLALAAAIVLVVTRPEPIERRWAGAANVALTLVALGALATSVYTIYFVTVGGHDSRYFALIPSAERHRHVATAIAFGLLAIGTLALTARALRSSSVDTDRGGGDVDLDVVELQPG